MKREGCEENYLEAGMRWEGWKEGGFEQGPGGRGGSPAGIGKRSLQPEWPILGTLFIIAVK